MKSGHGSASWKRTRWRSTTVTSRTLSCNCLAPLARRKLNWTSSAVKGSPLWNLSPSRSLNSYTNPSGLSVQDSAKLLPICSPGKGRTSASWSACSAPKGGDLRGGVHRIEPGGGDRHMPGDYHFPRGPGLGVQPRHPAYRPYGYDEQQGRTMA